MLQPASNKTPTPILSKLGRKNHVHNMSLDRIRDLQEELFSIESAIQINNAGQIVKDLKELYTRGAPEGVLKRENRDYERAVSRLEKQLAGELGVSRIEGISEGLILANSPQRYKENYGVFNYYTANRYVYFLEETLEPLKTGGVLFEQRGAFDHAELHKDGKAFVGFFNPSFSYYIDLNGKYVK